LTSCSEPCDDPHWQQVWQQEGLFHDRKWRVAWLALAGFVVVLITWIGTSSLGGYHDFG